MKNKLLPVTILILSLFTAANGFSQSKKFFCSNRRTVWKCELDCISPGRFRWKNSRKNIIYSCENNEPVYDALTGKQIISNEFKSCCFTFTATLRLPLITGWLGLLLLMEKITACIIRKWWATNCAIWIWTVASQNPMLLPRNCQNFQAQPGEASLITRMCIACG